ncbi:MAG: hypothetical protein DPW11_00720 [bacterium]|nr:hypothetical protein [Candidatus Microgenomates bacterium CPR3]MCQ3944290.1 hypothetical protein [bacterium]RIK51840.1 MAG: hypothetical protein DCC61_01305 [Candidatus Microgenomates bacterium]
MAKFMISKLNLRTSFIVLGIFIISSITHLYRINELHTFHNDEGRDAMIASAMIETGSPTLLGPQTSVGNMYLGPIYYYFMVPGLLLAGGDPVGPAIMIALSGILTSIGLYFYGRRMFSAWVGVAAALVMSLSPIFIHYTKSSWNPNLIPFIALLMLFTYDKKQYLFLGLLGGILFQLHYVAMLFFATLTLSLLYQSRSVKGLITIIGGFFISSLPFWVFEIRHDWINLQAFFNFIISERGSDPNTPSYLSRFIQNGLKIITDLIASKTLTNNTTPNFMVVLSAILLVLTKFTLPKKGLAKSTYNFLLIIILVSVAGTSILRDAIHPHYIGYLFPIISLAIAAVFASGSKIVRIFGVIFFVVWLIHSVPVTYANMTAGDSHQKLKGREVAGYIMRDAKDHKYNVVAAYDNSRETTYLFYLHKLNNPPTNEASDLLYIICEDRPCTEEDVNSPAIYNRGPAHPSLISYLAHPYRPSSDTTKTLVSSTHIVYGVWVARVIVGQ